MVREERPALEETAVEIATGYFARAKAYAERGYALVSIARVAPWFLAKELRVYSCDCLAPTDEILDLKDNPDEYTPKYCHEILGHLKPTEVFHYLWMIAHQEDTDKIILLCYESPEKFCHRHLVAKWLTDSLGQKVEEFNLAKKPEQRSLLGFDESSYS